MQHLQELEDSPKAEKDCHAVELKSSCQSAACQEPGGSTVRRPYSSEWGQGQGTPDTSYFGAISNGGFSHLSKNLREGHQMLLPVLLRPSPALWRQPNLCFFFLFPSGVRVGTKVLYEKNGTILPTVEQEPKLQVFLQFFHDANPLTLLLLVVHAGQALGKLI